ncbi:MAG: DUF523 and DUF1722 domain-containing protein [Spirochaetes bacterium]|nr:DUF523 and DUF1722 domain-containing protein [Spirochaetota bacterium]
MNFATPTICISACLAGEQVRYDGQAIHDDFVKLLLTFSNAVNVCPELAIGLGVPRARILVYYHSSEFRLFQPATGLDITQQMKEFSDWFLSAIGAIDGFILKAKSPSCGISGTKIYKDSTGTIFHSRGKGLFAMRVLERFEHIPAEDEGKLRDESIREHFLVRVFSFADLRRTISQQKTIGDLIEFHQNYKYLLMTYNQHKLRQLGKIVASYQKGEIDSVIREYTAAFYSAFKKKPSPKNHINTILHIFGYFSKSLTADEKNHFLHLIEQYQESKIRRKVLIDLLRNWAHRFGNSYLLSQKYLNPYPEELHTL